MHYEVSSSGPGSPRGVLAKVRLAPSGPGGLRPYVMLCIKTAPAASKARAIVFSLRFQKLGSIK